MRALFIQISIAVITLLVPEILKDTFEWLRRSPYWRLIQIAVVIWIVVIVLVSSSKDWFEWSREHRFISTILFSAAGALLFGSGFLFLSYHQSSSDTRDNNGGLLPNRISSGEIKRPRPHLQAELIIDSVKDEAIPFHVRITNIGDLDITDVKINQNATVVRSTGLPSPMLPLIKVLPKRGHVSMQGIDPSGLAKVRQFYATLTFKCLINGEANDFLASYRFVLPEGALTPQQVIDLRDSIETTGHELTAEVLREEANTSMSDWFATRPSGTISFWTTEKNKTGEANYIKIGNDTRTLCYDPAAHKIWLSSKPVSEALMMSFEPKDRHHIAFTWDESGPKLVSVDGKSKTR